MYGVGRSVEARGVNDCRGIASTAIPHGFVPEWAVMLDPILKKVLRLLFTLMFALIFSALLMWSGIFRMAQAY